jgi:hypothetical protein
VLSSVPEGLYCKFGPGVWNMAKRLIRLKCLPERDHNAKHTNSVSKLITHKGCELLKMMESTNLKHLYWGEHTGHLIGISYRI